MSEIITYTEDEIRRMLWDLIRDPRNPKQAWKFRSQAAFAEHIGMEPAHLNHVLKGTKPLDGRTLGHLGLERVVTYRKSSQ